MPKLSLAKLERHLYSAADRLRQEGLDAATYKDYIFGMLFLKRCSDVFDAERENIVGRKIEQGMVKEAAETQYGENPDFYDGFFVPERARWTYLQSKLSDASEPFGSVLDKALGALSEYNESLEHVLDHIQFMRMQSNKRIVSDDASKDLVRHFNRHRLRNEDFQFSDLLGAAYEFLINMFAESAGKKGGDFYTPRDVIRLTVRILKPTPGLSVYDPTCGSGGMLIISREFIEQSGGDPTNLRLCGQVNDASAWSICKLNMLLHGVPGAEVQAKRPLCDALGFDPAHAFLAQPGKEHKLFPSPLTGEGQGKGVYLDFAPTLADRSAIRPLIENDSGVQARAQALCEGLTAWWTAHAPRLAELPEHHELNRVRAEFLLDTFGAALLPLEMLDRFKLAGVITTWWTDTLPDFKTLLENGFPGVIDGWVDAIADAVEDDEAAGPSFDPFGHKLVRRIMADYLERIAAAKADIARLKGEKEAFEQSNAPDDADEEELANWNYAKDLDRQIKELKAEHKDALKELAKLEKAAAKAHTAKNNSAPSRENGYLFPPSPGGRELEGGRPLCTAKAALQPVLNRLAAIEAELAPYEQIKTDLAAARARYRKLTDAFVGELKNRCRGLSEDEKCVLVLELFAQDVQAGLDAAVAEKRQELVRFIEALWDKYRVTLTELRCERRSVEERLEQFMQTLAYR